MRARRAGRPAPRRARAGTDARGREHTIALEKDTTGIHSWGWGDFGRLGHGDSDDQFLPRPIKALASQPIAFVACGDSHSMFITPAGELLCCGRNQEGELGLGHNDDVRVPTRIPALKDEKIAGVACGAEHTVACTEGGALFAWGWGGYGNLGLGTTENQSSPCPVPGVSDIKSVACGWRHSCGIDGKGNLIVFGWNKYGQLGIGSFEHSLRAVAVEKIKQVKKVSGGWRHTAALTADGKLYCWGWNRFGQVGAGDQADKNEPTLVPKFAAAEVTDVVCGWRHTICITAENSVFSWGRGSDGQLGTGVAVGNSAVEVRAFNAHASCPCMHADR